MTYFVDEGKAVDFVYLDVTKAFDTISHRTLLEKLTVEVFQNSVTQQVIGLIQEE